jgi:ribosomal protein S18 acetylase RimI-like enzyme
MEIAEAQTLTLAQLAALFNQGYRGYSTPIEVDPPGMQRHLTHYDIDLTLSRVAIDDGLAAFALIGRRGPQVWVGGMGTAPDYRRQGIGERVLRAALDAATQAGARSARLEVLDDNERAIALYRKLGFATTRRLAVHRLSTAPRAGLPSSPVSVDAALGWIAAHRRSEEPWQRADASVAHLRVDGERLAAAAIDRDGDRVAAIVWADGEAAVRVLQVAAVDVAAAGDALNALIEVAGGRPVAAVNFPEDEELARAVSGWGIAPDLAQFEMELALTE